MTEQEKREKVIKGLGSCVEYFASKVKGVMFDEWLEESRKAIALLKAQEPVEPVYELGITRCGQCNHEIDKYGGDNYCPQCGKAVKWNG